MRNLWFGAFLGLIFWAAIPHPEKSSAATGSSITPTVLLQTQVATSGIPVTAIAAFTIQNGCWIQNDPSATTDLVVDIVNVANHTTPSPSAAFVHPGSTLVCPSGSSTLAVTIDAFDNGHKFFGVVY